MQLIASKFRRPLRGMGTVLKRLARDRSANALIEFAYAVPVFITLGMYGTELAYMSTVNMQVSQISMALADNASRLGQADNSAVAPTITNAMIDSVMDGAMQQGSSIKFSTYGRVILSSFEKQAVTNKQYIHWQKCRGSLSQASAYGTTGNGLITTMTGIGKKNVQAPSNNAVMFVEAYYSYQPLFGNMFVKNVKFTQEAALLVRDDRDLVTGVPLLPAGSSECS